MQQTVQDERSLRDMIESLWKGKLIIIATTIIAIILGVVYSSFMITEIYKATAVIMTTPVDLSKSSSDSEVIDYMAQYPVLTTETYLSQIKTPPVLEATIKALDLKREDGSALMVNQLAGMLEVKNIDKTNLINIDVVHQNPETAMQIANEISRQFTKFITDISRRQGTQTAGIILELLAEEELNMQQKSADLTSYLKEFGSIDLLKNEVSSLVVQITDNKAELNSLNARIAADTASLAVLLATLPIESQIDLDDFSVIIDLDQTSTDRSDLINQLRLDLNNDNLSNSLMQIELVKVQTRLLNDLTTRDALENQLNELDKTLQDRKINLNEEEYKYNALLRNFDLSKQTYTAYQTMYKDALLTAASDIGLISIVIAAEAILPVSSESPSRFLIIIISLVVGLLFGILVTLFLAYWANSKPTA